MNHLKTRPTWEYRVVCLPALEVQAALNEAGREGFQILHVDHRFNGHDENGVTYVVMGRESPVEEEPRSHARPSGFLP